MNSSFLKKAVPHLIALGIFLLVTIVYFQPAFQGKVVNQHDIIGWKGMAQQSFEFKEKNGHFPLWTNSLFSGMPAYNIALEGTHAVSIGYIYMFLSLGLPEPAQYFFIACICFYFLCMVMRIRPWLAILAALAYTYCSYYAVIAGVGHNSKMQAMALAPAVIASLLLLFERKYLWGTALLAIFFGLQVGTQHLQISYYTIIVMGFLTLAHLIKSFKQGQVKNAVVSSALAAVAGIIALGTYAVILMPMQEYAKESMRGGRSELSRKPGDKNATAGGLDKEYAFRWSYGIGETLTLIAPGVYGGSNGGREHTGSTAFTEKLGELGIPEENALAMANSYSYWGDQPNTAGPVYLGAVICFLFIFALVYVRSWHTWWILPAVVLGIIMAWGRHLPSVNYFLFDYLPFYNKFRAPSMSLVIPQLLVPLLGAYGIDKLLSSEASRDELFKKFKLSLYITAGIALILGLFYFSADFKGPNDSRIRDNFAQSIAYQQARGQQPTPEMLQQANSIAQATVAALSQDRKAAFGRDVFRSLIFIVLAAALVGGYIRNKIKPLPLMIGLLLLSSIDLIALDRRYMSSDNFVEKDEFESALAPNNADRQVMADQDKPFRVFDNTDESNGPFNSSRASYFHNSIGGYHPAKLGLYNDLIEYHIGNMNMNVLNMLNTRYFMFNDRQSGQSVAQRNPDAFGPAWFVKHIHYVPTPDDEIKSLDSIGLRDTVVIQEKFRQSVTAQPQWDSAATIKLAEYNNDKIVYKTNAAGNQFAVFSEIYYPLGWNVFIDGKQADYLKVNYALRGMVVPAGQHTIEFRFEPASYTRGNTITMIASLIAFLLLAAAIFMEVRKKKTN